MIDRKQHFINYEAPSNQVLSDFFFLQTGISIVVLFHPPFDFSKKKIGSTPPRKTLNVSDNV
jgi:hypothetical protein